MKKLAKNMEEMFHKKSEAVRVSLSVSVPCCAETHRQLAFGDRTDEPVVKFAHYTDVPSYFFTLGVKKSSSSLPSSLMGCHSQFVLSGSYASTKRLQRIPPSLSPPPKLCYAATLTSLVTWDIVVHWVAEKHF